MFFKNTVQCFFCFSPMRTSGIIAKLPAVPGVGNGGTLFGGGKGGALCGV